MSRLPHLFVAYDLDNYDDLLTSFATRTKNIENKPIINERGTRIYHFMLCELYPLMPTLHADNRPAPKPHFAAPLAPKPAPTILQPITTAGSSSTSGPSSTAVGKARASLAPNAHGPRSRVPRVSTIGAGGSGYQRFALPGGGRKSLESVDEKAAAGGFGVLGLTEKEIEEKVRISVATQFRFIVLSGSELGWIAGLKRVDIFPHPLHPPQRVGLGDETGNIGCRRSSGCDVGVMVAWDVGLVASRV